MRFRPRALRGTARDILTDYTRAVFTAELETCDPPVERPFQATLPQLSLHFDEMRTLDHQNAAFELQRSFDDLCYLLDSLPSIPDSFISRHDIVPFLLKFAGQTTNFVYQHFAVYALVRVLEKSDMAVDQFVTSGALELGRALLLHPVSDVQRNGYWLLCCCHRTAAGYGACMGHNVWQSDVADAFSRHLRDASLLAPASKSFVYMAGHMRRDAVVEDFMALALACYGAAIYSYGVGSRFYEDAVDFCLRAIQNGGDPAIRHIIKSAVCQHAIGVLREAEDKDVVMRSGQLVQALCTTRERGLQREIVAAIDFAAIRARIVGARCTRVYVLFVRIAQSVATLAGEFEWVLQPPMSQTVAAVLDSGAFPEKIATAQLVLMVLALGSVDQIRRVFQMGLAAAVVEVAEASQPVELIRGLRAIGKAIQTVERHGMEQWTQFNSFVDEAGPVLLRIADGQEKEAAKIAQLILAEHFPELCYGG